MLSFESDYTEGAHEAILHRLMETNLEQTPGYGLDKYSESAKDRIREAFGIPDAKVFSWSEAPRPIPRSLLPCFMTTKES